MNFNYSYRALLITSLLFGILFLLFKSINLSKYEYINEEKLDIEFSEEEVPSEEEIAAMSNRDMKVETNKAFNEAEKFISELEKARLENTPTTEGKKQQESTTDNSAEGNLEGSRIASNKKPIAKVKKELSTGMKKTDEMVKSSSSKRNSTVSYRLVDRTQIELPNPVYTCGSYGKVVINIEVNALGKVTKAHYNDAASTTRNECLIESAIAYAKQSYFTTASDKPKQLGSITYNFQGQE